MVQLCRFSQILDYSDYLQGEVNYMLYGDMKHHKLHNTDEYTNNIYVENINALTRTGSI